MPGVASLAKVSVAPERDQHGASQREVPGTPLPGWDVGMKGSPSQGLPAALPYPHAPGGSGGLCAYLHAVSAFIVPGIDTRDYGGVPPPTVVCPTGQLAR